MNNYLINANEVSNSRKYGEIASRRGVARCIICGDLCHEGDGSERISLPNNPRGVTLCYKHGKNFYCYLNNYSFENTQYIGGLTEKRVSQSYEIESENNTARSSAVMFSVFKASATSDGSLEDRGIEWKSAIYRSLCGATKLFGAIEAMNNNGDFNTLSEDCGAHIHTGIIDESNRDVYNWSEIFPDIDTYYSVFSGLYEYLDKMPNAKMREYFGRGYVNYARTLRKDADEKYVLPRHDGNGKIIKYSEKYLNGYDDLYGTRSYNCTQHYLVFNLQHSYSLEFRLPKFVSAVQYRRCALAMQDVVLCIEKLYIKKHDAEKCNKALVKIFSKYFPY